MKKTILSLSLALLMFSPSNVFADSDTIKVYIENEIITFEQQPIIENDVTLVQFRPIFEKLGLNIQWNESTKTIVGFKDGFEINLQINSTSAVINGNKVELQVAPKVVDGNTLVPLRFVGEASNLDVTWKSETKEVFLNKKTTEVSKSDISRTFDFRETVWGMSREQVKKSEKTKPTVDNDKGLVFINKISNDEAKIAYLFDNNKLNKAAYFLKSPTIPKYEEFKKLLSEKYGEPKFDTFDVKKQLSGVSTLKFENNGTIRSSVTWETKTTSIAMTIEGKNFDVTEIAIMYSDKTYVEPKPSSEGL